MMIETCPTQTLPISIEDTRSLAVAPTQRLGQSVPTHMHVTIRELLHHLRKDMASLAVVAETHVAASWMTSQQAACSVYWPVSSMILHHLSLASWHFLGHLLSLKSHVRIAGLDQSPTEAPRDALQTAAAVAATAAASWRFEARLQELELALRTAQDHHLAERVRHHIGAAIQCVPCLKRGAQAQSLRSLDGDSASADPLYVSPRFRPQAAGIAVVALLLFAD